MANIKQSVNKLTEWIINNNINNNNNNNNNVNLRYDDNAKNKI